MQAPLPPPTTAGRRWRMAAARWLATLKARVVLLAVLTGLLSAAGTAAVVLHSAGQSIRQMVLQSARDDRARHAVLLGSKVAVLRDLLQAVARGLPRDAWSDPAAMGRILLDRPALAAVFDTVYTAGTDGIVSARVEAGRLTPERPDISGRDYFRRAMATGQPVVSDALWGAVRKAPVVVVAVPVRDADGRPQGLLAGVLALSATALFDNQGLTTERAGVQDVVIDQAGRLLTHPDPARLMSLVEDDPQLRAAGRAALGTAAMASAVVHADAVVSMAPIPYTRWISLHLSPLDEAMAPVTEARRAALPAALAAGLAAGLLAGGLGYVLTGPIRRLQRRAELLGDDGAADLPWPADGGEVGELARAFRSVVEERARRQAEVQALVHQLEAVLDHADVGIALTRHGAFELVSRQFCLLFRCTEAAMVGQPTRVIYPDDAAFASLVGIARAALTESGMVDTELQLQRRDGEVFWARMRGRAVVPGDMAHGTIWTIEDVTATRAQREQLSWRADHDALTGLLNRSAFERALEAAAAKAAEAPFCALFIDLDRFKQLNDSAGHAAGDAMLREVGQLLLRPLRKSDLVARLGGDEFAVLLPGCPVAKAQALADALCGAVQQHRLTWDGVAHGVGASVGLVAVDGRFSSAADVLRAADTACYQAKRRGRGQVAQFVASDFQTLAA